MTPEDFFNSADVLNLRPGDRAVLIKDGKVYVAKNYPEHGAAKITFLRYETYQSWVKAGEPYLFNPSATPLNKTAEQRIDEAIRSAYKELVEGTSQVYEKAKETLIREGGYMTRAAWGGNSRVFWVSPVEQGFEKIRLDGSQIPLESFMIIQQGDNPAKVYSPSRGDLVAKDWQNFTKRYVQHS